MADDYYALLGVTRTASDDEIKKAYRTLARQLHPDLNPGDAEAEERFKQVSTAYETLADPERRARYDRFGPEGAARGGAQGFDPSDLFGGGGLGDIFDAFFGGGGGGAGGRRGPSGPPRGQDLETVLEVELVEAVFGAEREVQLRAPVVCEPCEGTGARPGTSATTCGTCGGAGEVRRVRQSILGQMVTASVCPRCGGMGQEIADPCDSCRGEGRVTQSKVHKLVVPAGVDDGTTLRLTGKGAAGARGGGYGDLYVHLRVRAQAGYRRDRNNLVVEVHVPFTSAALGATLPFETLDGPEQLVVPAGTQTGREVRFRGLGVPDVHRPDRRGDLIAVLVVDTPTGLNARQEELLRQLAAERGEEVAPPDHSLLGRIKSAFK